jgi:uncharacterized protein YyaL (SSP411 family)
MEREFAMRSIMSLIIKKVMGWGCYLRLLFFCLLCLLFVFSSQTLQASPVQGGSMEQTNRLINEQSPYLLQHAHNPVDWYPWGEEAFARAKAEDKPIFLSIGYSTCHWCHVMAHESFESAEIAAILNKWFICIKVDREERPDIDQMYMAATQAMNGSGGWPMSVFTFADGRPFWAATYIPPKEMRGQPGFPDILAAVHTAWTTRRDELVTAASSLVSALQSKGEGSQSADVGDDVAEQVYHTLISTYDSRYKGFGNAPKFPRPVNLSFLFRYWHATGNEQAKEMALETLQAMARGGMYDQLGGGFHRYSVDSRWRVPHFEKMLYDQAQLLDAYLDAYQITGKKEFADVARQVGDYVLRDMRDSAGGFYSAEDADSDDPYEPGKHGEGAFYLWTEKDIVRTLGAQDANVFNFCYGVEFDGNVLTDPQKEFTGRNILYLAQTPQQAAVHFTKDAEEIRKILGRSSQKLAAKRAQRKRPHLDDKVLASWNGLMLGALARAGAILGRPEFTRAATAAATFIHKTLYNPETGVLKRRYRKGRAGIAGQLDDYAFLTAGLLDLYKVEQDPQWLEWAIALTNSQIELFADTVGGGFFDSQDDPTVVVRMKNDYDGAEPAPNTVAAENLVRLSRLLDKEDWHKLAEKTVNSFAAQLKEYPHALVKMVAVHQELEQKPLQVVVAGNAAARDTRQLLATVLNSYAPGLQLVLADSGANQHFLAKFLPSMQTVPMQDNRATAYVCRNTTCMPPVTSADALRELLDKSSKNNNKTER